MFRTSLPGATLEKGDVLREEQITNDLESELSVLEVAYASILADLETTQNTKYVSEFERVWEALIKRQAIVRLFYNTIKDNVSSILHLNFELNTVMKNTQTDQDIIERLKAEVESAWRMVDVTHAREQVGQETIENLRGQISRLNAEMELKTKQETADQEVDQLAAKQKELQTREKDKLVSELQVLREKYDTLITEQEDLENKCNSATKEMIRYKDDLELKNIDLAKEIELGEKTHKELQLIQVELDVKTKENVTYKTQIAQSTTHYARMEKSLRIEKAANSKLHEEHRMLNEKFSKLRGEFQAQAIGFDKITSKINIVARILKTKEDEIKKLIIGIQKGEKKISACTMRLEKAEGKCKRLEKDKDKFRIEGQMMKRESLRQQKLLVEDKRVIEQLTREKEHEKKTSTRLDSKIQELTRRLNFSDQVKANLQMDLDAGEKEVSKIKQVVVSLGKEKDRYIKEAKDLTMKVEAILEESKMKTSEIFNLKKELIEAETQFKQQQNLFEVIRTERNACSKELLEAQDEIVEFKEKVKVLIHQVEQLKEDISCKENQLTREELAYRKIVSEKESLVADVQRWRDVVKDYKQTVENMKEQLQDVRNAVDISEDRRHKLKKELDHILNERDILGSQLVRRNDELTLLYEKGRILQVSLDRGKVQYSQRLDDIRILKLEVDQLRNEKAKLTKVVNNATDFRTEIYHLERDLTKERLKSRALEEELQTPLNIHRWRKLEGSDPSKLELIQKIQRMQKRLLKGLSASQAQEQKIKEWEQRYAELKEKLRRMPGPDMMEKLGSAQSNIGLKNEEIVCLKGKICSYKRQVTELKLELETIKNQLKDSKILYYDQKKRSETYMLELKQLRSVTVKTSFEGNDAPSKLPPICNGGNLTAQKLTE